MKRSFSLRLVLVCVCASSSVADESTLSARRAESLVRRALEAELSGDNATREAGLRAALEVDSDSAARWHLGYVRNGQQWECIPQDVGQLAHDRDLAAYAQLRQRLAGHPAGELRLAKWCDNRGLTPYSRAHWYQVLRTAPQNKHALKALGLQRRDGQLVLSSEIVEEEAADRASKRSDEDLLKPYRKHLRGWRRTLVTGDSDEREPILRQLRSMSDDVALLLISELLMEPTDEEARTAELQREAMLLLGKMKDARTARLLAAFAAMSSHVTVREAATESLRRRPIYHSVPALLAGLVTPLELGVATVATEDGVVARYSFEREGPNGQVTYATLTAQRRLLGPKNIVGGHNGTQERGWFPEHVGIIPSPCGGAHLGVVPAGIKTVLTSLEPVYIPNPEYQARQQSSLQGARQQGRAVQTQVSQLNQMTARQNERVAAVLRQLTGEQLKPDPRAWWNWWQDYVDECPELLHEAFQDGMDVASLVLRPTPMALAEGTLVWTSIGRRPIQELRVSDLVLSQHPDTGELAYKPILGMASADSPQIRVRIAGDVITSSPGQAFWRTGEAWWRGCDLEAEQFVHGLSGSFAIIGKSNAPESRTVQLIVAEFNNFFVGRRGLLVHDASAPRPSNSALPGFDG